MLDERTQTRDMAAGLFRGLAAAARGYVGAKVAVARATNERELQKAHFALETARTGLIKQKQDFEAQHARDTLASQERQATAQREHETKLQEVIVDGQKAIAKIGVDGQMEIMRVQQAGETERAGLAEEGANTRAGIAADTAREGMASQERIAEGDQAVQREGIESQERIAAGQQEGETTRAQMDADLQREIATIQQEIATQGYASQESVARIEAMGKNMGFNFGGGVSMLNEDEWGRLLDMMTKVSQNKDMTIIRQIKGGFVTAMQGFIDASQNGPMSQQAAVANSEEAQSFGFSMADMAIINGYQRMIDPGATVREGDVDALIASMAKSEQLRAFVNQYIGTGGRFTPEGRQALAELVLNQYNANVDARVPGLAGQLTDVLRASGLEGRGIGMDFFDMPQREQRSIDQILQAGGDWATGIGTEAQQTQPAQGTQPEGTVPSGQAPPAGDAGESQLPLMGWAEDYQKGREQGMSDDDLDAALRNAILESGVPEAQVESVLSQVKSRVDATGRDTEIGQTEMEMDEASRMVKIAQPSQLEVADLDDTETYRALKVKFAPAGYIDYTEQEWNRFKGQTYQNLIDDGASEEFARAFIAKLKAEIEGSDGWASDTEVEE